MASIEMAEKMANESENCFLPCQFSNIDNVLAHKETTGPEMWWQLQYNNYSPDAFVAGVGTGGTIMGVGQFLKSVNKNVKIHAMEPANSPTLRAGKKVGHHRIQGISDEFIPSIVDLDQLDEIIDVDDGDAIIVAQKMASELGSGGGNLVWCEFPCGSCGPKHDLTRCCCCHRFPGR